MILMKLSRLERKTKIVPFSPVHENGKRVIYYCDFGWHQGMINDAEKVQECVNRHCSYLFKFLVAYPYSAYKR